MSTLIMYAEANVNPPIADVHVFPLGISGIYAFMSDGVPPQLAEEDIIRVLFPLDTEFSDAEADLLCDFGAHFNWVLPNKPGL